VVRAAVALSLALPLITADLWLKAEALTPEWAYHERSAAWVLMCLALVPGLLLVTRIPAGLVPPAAGVLLAGVLGNVLSAAWNDLSVPNPILVRGDRALLAFNLADLYTLVGIVLLMAAVGVWLVRNRMLLPGEVARRERRRDDWDSEERPLI
jgi:hypothetical protein